MSILENVALIRQQIAAAAKAAGRDPGEILLCAATKMNDSARVRQAVAAGVDVCGENRVQELTRKLSENAYEGAPVHFIGHLQTNKVRQVVGKVSLIQSVDSLRLLSAIHQEAKRQGIVQNILLEVNVGQEDSKSGFTPEELPDILKQMADYPFVHVEGLMAIPPRQVENQGNLKYFRKMADFLVDIKARKYDNVEGKILSMGMSDDFAEAIACGSTMVRVGTAIFGQRNYS